MPPIDFTRRTALYRLFNAADELLYVGIAFDPDARWDYHAGSAAWWPQVARKSVEWLDSRALALQVEAAAIVAEAPLYNVRGSQIPSQIPRDPNPRRTPNRPIRADDETWAEYGLACEALGLNRSVDMRMHAKERIAEWKREQRRIVRESAGVVSATKTEPGEP